MATLFFIFLFYQFAKYFIILYNRSKNCSWNKFVNKHNRLLVVSHATQPKGAKGPTLTEEVS